MVHPIRVGVIGAGYWGTKVAREYANIQGCFGEATLDWIADSSDDALDRVRTVLGGERKYTKDYSEVLEAQEVDAVHIALSNQSHYKVARQALESGKHVLVEKPMALSSDEAWDLVRMAETRGLALNVGHIFRFNNSVHMVRQIMREGRLGKVFYANLRWGSDIPPPEDRDIVFDLAPHPIDVLNFILEEWPIRIDAVGESYVRNEDSAEEVSFVNLRFQDRIIASVYLSWIQHGLKERSITVVGSRGTVVCDALDQCVKLYSHSSVVGIPRKEFPDCMHPRERIAESEPRTDAPNNTIQDLERNFLQVVRGSESPLNRPDLGARNVEILESITRQMRSKRSQYYHRPLLRPYPS
jgi:UDP-N-acetylglucosamine 3-dehydrogenase